MIYREALVTAIDTLLASDDAHSRAAAKVLTAKLSRLRVGALVGIADRDWCDCGERKRPELNFCHACNAAFPLKLVITWLTARGPKSARAFAQMKAIAQTRLEVEAMRKAA